jgi:hypothetical protein
MALKETETETANKDDHKEMKVFKTNYDLFLDYTEYSTIQGLIYIFATYQTIIGRIFWTTVLLFMFSLGIYWCVQSYQNWKGNQVLTTVTTTDFSINEVCQF